MLRTGADVDFGTGVFTVQPLCPDGSYGQVFMPCLKTVGLLSVKFVQSAQSGGSNVA